MKNPDFSPTSPRLLPTCRKWGELGEKVGKKQGERSSLWRKSIIRADARDGRFLSVKISAERIAKSALFFGQEMMLARRSLGLSYGPFACDEMFTDFCSELFRYQYVQNKTVLDDSILQWLYNHSRGNISIVVGLLHDAQEISILDGYEKIDITSLERAYRGRLAICDACCYSLLRSEREI